MTESFEPRYRGPERRRDKRRKATLPGHVVHTGKGDDAPCILLDISPGGAAIICSPDFSPGDEVALSFEQLGKFQGTVVTGSGGRVSIKFDQNPRARRIVMEKIARFSQRHFKRPAAPAIRETVPSRFIWSDGRVSDCNIENISLTEASLRTPARPPMNDIIRIGLSSARVVSHHERGIAVEFLCQNARTK